MQHRPGAAQGGPQIVGHHHHRHALLPVQVGEGLVQILGRGGVQAGNGLVQDQQAAGGTQGPGQQHPLLLAAGEIPVALVLQLQNPQLAHVHQCRGLLGGGVEEPQPLLVQAAREDHFIHRGREVPLGPGLLGQIAHGSLPQFRRPENLPGLGGEEPQQAPQQRGLAGAVVPHDAQVVPRPDGEIQVGQDALTLIPQGRVPADDQLIGLHGGPPLRRRRRTPRKTASPGIDAEVVLPLQVVVQVLQAGTVHMADAAAALTLQKKAIPVALGLAAAVLVQGALLGVDLVDRPGGLQLFQLAVDGGQAHRAAPPDAGPPPVRRRCRRSRPGPPGSGAPPGAVWCCMASNASFNLKMIIVFIL